MTPDERVFAWVLGTDGGVGAEDMRNAGIPYSAHGLFSRMFAAFPGNPVAPAQQLTVGTTPTGLTVPGLACSALISVEGDSLRLRLDGTEVSTTVGLLLPVGSIFNVTGMATLKAARLCGISGATVVDVNYWT